MKKLIYRFYVILYLPTRCCDLSIAETPFTFYPISLFLAREGTYLKKHTCMNNTQNKTVPMERLSGSVKSAK